MLYTKKGVEKLFTDLVADYIANGAVIDLQNCGNYVSSEYDCHVDLVAADHSRIVIFIKTGKPEAFYSYNKGTCNISVKVYHPTKRGRKYCYFDGDVDTFPVYQLYKYKNVYTDDLEEYQAMIGKADKRTDRADHSYDVKYNSAVIISILKKHEGFKRAKPENIYSIKKYNGKYCITINFSGNCKYIEIG